MTPKEAFQRIELVIELADDSVNTNTATGRELEEAIIRIIDEIKLVGQALNELEELKRDVKRYFDLGHIEEPSTEQFEEYLKLTDKLLKVGIRNEKYD